MWRNSFTRLPGNFLLSSLYALPAWAAVSGPGGAAFLAGQQMVRLADYAVAPLGTVLLPWMAMAQGDSAKLRGLLRPVWRYALLGGLGSMLLFLVGGPLMGRIWLGRSIPHLDTAMRLMGFSVAPLWIYGALRSAVEAVDDAPHTTYAVLIGNAIVVGGGLFVGRGSMVAWSITQAVSLSGMAGWICWRAYRPFSADFETSRVIL